MSLKNCVKIVEENVCAMELCQNMAESVVDDFDPFYVMNVDRVVSQYDKWMQVMPNITPHYAVKCNSDPVLIQILANLGTGFDCASKREMEVVRECVPWLPMDKIIYANPCKTRSHIKAARTFNVTKMTFDCAEELIKIKQVFLEAQVVLRINVGDPTAICQLNTKFGCDPETEGPQLLQIAKDLGLQCIGISFHVGSGCQDASAFDTAIYHASKLMQQGNSIGHKMQLLDIGGGFPGELHNHPFFDQIGKTVNNAISEYLGNSGDIRVIAEPGRFFACAAYQLCCNIIAINQCDAFKITKIDDDRGLSGVMYYINDGVYGSFNCILYDHVCPPAKPLFNHCTEMKMTAVWGPTCDGLDLVIPQTRLPLMQEGDWLTFENMGAYTMAAGSEFNGFTRPSVHYYATQKCIGILVCCNVECASNEEIEEVESNTSFTSSSD